jgi:hypothetical protein
VFFSHSVVYIIKRGREKKEREQERKTGTKVSRRVKDVKHNNE